VSERSHPHKCFLLHHGLQVREQSATLIGLMQINVCGEGIVFAVRMASSWCLQRHGGEARSRLGEHD